MKRVLLMSFLLAACVGSVQAQLYKSVGPDGKISYSDTPPATASKVEVKPIANGSGSQGLPFEVAEAMRNNPVVIYTSVNCPSCDEGRQMLRARGTPYTEKSVVTKEDIDAFRRAGGDKVLPYMIVGRVKQEGFEVNAWNRLLATAGYPEENKLPKTYRFAPAESAAPSQKVTLDKEKNSSTSSPAANTNNGELPEPIGNAPPGFRF